MIAFGGAVFTPSVPAEPGFDDTAIAAGVGLARFAPSSGVAFVCCAGKGGAPADSSLLPVSGKLVEAVDCADRADCAAPLPESFAFMVTLGVVSAAALESNGRCDI